jgi:ribosome-associated toxin RatA of RatAB toxin-antitoxin module
MRSVCLRLHVPNQPASDVYATLADFGRYPELCEAVRSVTITERSGNRTVSAWEVTFRAGLLRWTEEDTFDPAAMRITFRQTEGDIAVFDGTWQCLDRQCLDRQCLDRQCLDQPGQDAAAGGTEIVFNARLDMGIPSLADALEPIAARTLTDNIVSIVRGLVGHADLIESDIAVPVRSA